MFVQVKVVKVAAKATIKALPILLNVLKKMPKF